MTTDAFVQQIFSAYSLCIK